MSEFIGLCYFAEIPAVVIDVQRGGPSTGMPTRTQQSDVMKAAYLSHGDTKHVLLFPEDPHECFTMAADCLDLAERLQTPVFLMTDLDIGMNQRLCKPLEWDDNRAYDRGKVMTAEMLDAGKEFARYKDLDGDGIPFRTYPGTHATKGAYFTRGTSRDPRAVYSEKGEDYQYNMERLLKKFDFAKTLVPKPLLTPAKEPARFGVIYYGSTSPSMQEALESLARQNIFINALRIRAFPFQDEILDFCESHSKVFVVEQNRDAQLKTLLVNDAGIQPHKLISVLHYDGTPITARFITKEISEIVSALNVRPIKKDKAA
jgi:2-oxoglutarate ferredoxin oxidoreductase subunit alpha